MPAKRFSFTKAGLDALPLPSGCKPAFYYDDKIKALCLSVSRRGNKMFYLYRRIGHRPTRIAIGPYPDMSIEQARAKALVLNSAIACGEDPLDSRRAAEKIPTLGEAFEKYIQDYARHHCKTWKVMIENFNRYLKHWRDRKLDKISKNDVQLLVNGMGRENGRATANRTVEMLRAVINKARQWDLFPGANPCDGVSKFKLKSRDRFLQADELPRFFASVAQEEPLIRDFVLICLLTGARKGNVEEMRWEHVNLERATWFIPETKNGESQHVPLVPKALEILQERYERRGDETEWVFPGTGVTGHLVSPKNAWLRIKKRAGLPDIHLHDLRRTLGSWQAATGASLAIIGKTLNHKDISTTTIYARLSLDPVRSAMDVATAAILKVVDGDKKPEENSEVSNVRPFRYRNVTF